MRVDVEVNVDEDDIKDTILDIMETQLDEFIARENPKALCGLGQSFQKAVTKACNGMITEAVHQDTMDSSEIRTLVRDTCHGFVREELRSALLGMMRGWGTRD